MDNLLLFFIIFDVLILYVIYRFMGKKLKGKLEQVEQRQRAKWEKDEAKLKLALSKIEEE